MENCKNRKPGAGIKIHQIIDHYYPYINKFSSVYIKNKPLDNMLLLLLQKKKCSF